MIAAVVMVVLLVRGLERDAGVVEADLQNGRAGRDADRLRVFAGADVGDRADAAGGVAEVVSNVRR
jgi:hypothetical protein